MPETVVACVFIDSKTSRSAFRIAGDRFDIVRVLERLVRKGQDRVKKAYADWSDLGRTRRRCMKRQSTDRDSQRAQTGKNSADIRLVVDATIWHTRRITSTPSSSSPRLRFSRSSPSSRRNGKPLSAWACPIRVGTPARQLRRFIYYEDRQGHDDRADAAAGLPETKQKAFGLLLESCLALRRETGEPRRVDGQGHHEAQKPSFNESYHGYRLLSDLLLDAQKEGLVELEIDGRSRTYVVTRFGAELPKPVAEVPVANSRRRRPRSRSANSRTTDPPRRDTAAARRAAEE